MASKDFFLSPDEAQTLGNINYMRKSIKVRHTFPKNLTNPNGLETVKEVSSLDEQSINPVQESRQESSFASSTFQENTISQVKSVPSSNNMNMFRNMARTIRKR